MSKVVWTPEQDQILHARDRVVLVKAGPGSGKTKVFVELLNRRLATWGARPGGIAALSFTNVAKDEISTRLGGYPPPPHFVGTLDAFFLRFVVGPFGHLAGVRPEGARLVPSPVDEELQLPSALVGAGGKARDRCPLFCIWPCGGSEDAPVFAAKQRLRQGFVRVEDDCQPAVCTAKAEEWKVRGRVTHGDSHFIAASVLNGDWGESVCRLVGQRFPLILVDELQDTGYFLARALLSLAASGAVEAVLVGDEDQRIFGFAGDDPQLFRRLESLPACAVYPMRVSQRCSRSVARVASRLTRSGSVVEATADSPEGVAFLLAHDDAKASPSSAALARARSLCRDHGVDSLTVLVRRRVEKRGLTGSLVKDACPLRARGPATLHKAVVRLFDGRGDQSAALAESCLAHALMGLDVAHRADLHENGVDAAEFHRAARRLVLESARSLDAETWGQWRDRMKKKLTESVAYLGGHDYARRTGGMFRQCRADSPDRLRDMNAVHAAERLTNLTREVLTIHEAKGREFDAVLVYCSKPQKLGEATTCPSDGWWPDAPDSEEREAAFVATTRARYLLMLAVHSTSHDALRKKQPDFLQLFESAVSADQKPKREAGPVNGVVDSCAGAEMRPGKATEMASP